MAEVELELTYLARRLPEALGKCPSKLIVDVYYPAGTPHASLRIRRKDDHYEITKKVAADGADFSNQLEHTIQLTKGEYDTLTTAAGGLRVAKQRYYYDYQGRTAEIDVFEGELRGLVEIDFEFASREQQQAFQMPDFCLADVTQEEFAAGGMLAGKSYAAIADELARYNYQPLFMDGSV